MKLLLLCFILLGVINVFNSQVDCDQFSSCPNKYNCCIAPGYWTCCSSGLYCCNKGLNCCSSLVSKSFLDEMYVTAAIKAK